MRCLWKALPLLLAVIISRCEDDENLEWDDLEDDGQREDPATPPGEPPQDDESSEWSWDNLDDDEDGAQQGDADETSEGQTESSDGEPGHFENSEPLPPEQILDLHAKMDGDKNGKVTIQEFRAYASKMHIRKHREDVEQLLSDLDEDDDGVLRMDEFFRGDPEKKFDFSSEGRKHAEAKKAQGELERKEFNRADANKDGQLDFYELGSFGFADSYQVVTFARKDKNRDGKISHEEFWTDILQEFEGTPDEKPAYVKKREPVFSKADMDKDGFLDFDELWHYESGELHVLEVASEIFHVADFDRDGQVGRYEFVAARHKVAEYGGSAYQEMLIWVRMEEQGFDDEGSGDQGFGWDDDQQEL